MPQGFREEQSSSPTIIFYKFTENLMGWFVGEQFYCSRGTLRYHKAFREEQSSSPTTHPIKAI